MTKRRTIHWTRSAYASTWHVLGEPCAPPPGGPLPASSWLTEGDDMPLSGDTCRRCYVVHCGGWEREP